MSKRILLGVADQVLAGDLGNRIEALEDYTIVHISEGTQELVPAVLNHDPDILVIDQDLPPGPISRVTQDLSTRRPALPVLLVSRVDRDDSLSLALEIGARAVLTYPFVLAEVSDALQRAVDWRERMLGVLTDGGSGGSPEGGVAVFTGSKGGVGTSVIAAHTAWMLAQQRPEASVCLVDLDLEKGDIPSFVDLNYRVSIVHLAKIADDITDRVVRDTVAVHESGLHILPAPVDVRDVDLVPPQAIRSILGQLRQMYDVVIVDAGSNVTPAQAAAVEMSDHTVQVVTTDVPSLRAARRQSQAWNDLGVRNIGDVWVLVNRFSRDAEIQQSTMDRLILGRRLETMIPDLGRGLEPAVNTRTPSYNAPKSWWKTLAAVVAETDLAPSDGTASPAPGRRPSVLRRRSRPAAAEPEPAAAERESGQAAIEAMGVLPVTVLLMLGFWQVVGLALSFVWAGEAANAAAREVSLGSSHSQVVQAARDAVPGVVQDAMVVQSNGRDVEVRVRVAPLGSGVAEVPVGIDRGVTKEPGA